MKEQIKLLTEEKEAKAVKFGIQEFSDWSSTASVEEIYPEDAKDVVIRELKHSL